MRAKVLKDINIYVSDIGTISANTELEVINGFCNTDGYYYICVMPDGRQFSLNSNLLAIIDYTPYVDWEQRRYEIAKAIVASVWSKSHVGMTMENIAEGAIEQANVLIEELKKNK